MSLEARRFAVEDKDLHTPVKMTNNCDVKKMIYCLFSEKECVCTPLDERLVYFCTHSTSITVNLIYRN